MDPKVSLLMTLVIVAQLMQIHSLPTTSNKSSKQTYSPDLYVFGGWGLVKENSRPMLLDSASRLKSTGEWAAMNPMPTGRAFFCGAVVDKRVYLFAGQTPTGRVTNDAEVYDSSTDTYTLLRPMPGSRNLCAAAALKDSVYVSGGQSSIAPTNSLFRYDIRTNQWSTLSPMNNYQYQHQMVELGGLLYAVGWFKNAEAYNPTTDKWSNVASTNMEHENGASAVAHQGKIYLLSNRGFEVFSPSSNHWSVLNAPAFVKNKGRSLVSMNGKLWTVGGDDYSVTSYNATNTNTAYTYDPSTDRWTKEREMNIPRAYHGAFVVNH